MAAQFEIEGFMGRGFWRSCVARLCVAAVVSVGPTDHAMAQGGDTITLIPDSELPRSVPRDAEEARARSEELLRKYPHDPRARLERAAFLLAFMHDVAGAERELRAGLAEDKALARVKPAVASALRATLAKTLAMESRHDEAIAMARPLCETNSSFRADVAKVGLCPGFAPASRAPGELDPARLAAVVKAADQLTALARPGRPPRASDPAAGALLDRVFDVGDLTREVPAFNQLAGLGRWTMSIGAVCEMYDLPAAPEAGQERMRDYSAEIGRCLDASLGASGAMLAATANPPADARGILMAMHPSPHETVVQTVQIMLAYMNRPEPADDWRRARLQALAALAARAGPLLTTDERRQLATDVLSASRTARDAEVRTGLMSVASRFGDK
ncbi:hypothetical protein QRQ56_03315 [Bradyrhizobium sp. U531]|uniref:hypothetical protein n=1 Tax=Bradyrhizobium sp. U531 TaxID=3053458 RepID=UPI003F41F8A0